MARKLLNARFVETVKPPATGRAAYADAHPRAPGLELIVAAGGRKSWSIRYRPKGMERRRVGYGSYPTISLEQARERAHNVANAAIRGIDLPAQEEIAAAEERREAGRPATVAALIAEYVEKHCKPNQRRWKLTERLFEQHVTPALGKKSLAELRRADIVELLDKLQNEKGFAAQVNRVRSQIIAALNWAIEREYLDTNPAAAIKRRKLETSRERVLSGDELRAIWKVADALAEPSRSLVKAWILTGQRRDEVRCMAWAEVNEGAAVWTIPGARNKGKRDHEVPLSSAMAELLAGLPRRGPFVFTADPRGAKPYAGQKRLKQILDRESGIKADPKTGAGGWTFHDFRRTASTGMAALNVPQDTIDRVLNHAKKTLAGTYNRHQYLEEKRRALTSWAEYVAFVVSDAREAANVVQLRA
jgi:integrase